MTAQSPIRASTEIRQSASKGGIRLVAGRIAFSIVGDWMAGVPLEFMAGIFIIGSECGPGPRGFPGPPGPDLGLSPRSGPGEGQNPETHENWGQPTAAVNIFVQEESGRKRVGDEGECGGCRAHNAEVGPRKPDEVAEKRDGHEEDSTKENSACGDSGDDGKEAMTTSELVEIADAAHGQGHEDVSRRSGAHRRK